ncbi:MAG: ATP-binding protein [Myxococcales bacterium]|nr:ATP-binding protein [Myxococcales bacterium]
MADVVELPAVCGLENADAIVACCISLEAADVAEIDARRCESIDAFAIATIAAAVISRHSRAESAPRFRAPASSETSALFIRLGFQELCESPNGDWKPASTFEARQLRAHDPAFVDRLADEFAQGANGVVEEARFSVRLCFMELLTNAFDHSLSPIGCLVASLRDDSGMVDCAVADAGIGIPRALRQSLRPGIAGAQQTDTELLVQAVTSGLTSRRERSGGLGLGNVRQQVVMRDGVMTIRSLSAAASFGPGLRVRGEEQGSRLGGTTVHARFDPRRPLHDSKGHEQVEVF